MNNRSIFPAILVLIIGVIAAGTIMFKSPTSDSALQLAASQKSIDGLDKRKQFKSYEYNEFIQMATEPETVLVDVRTPQEYSAGHLEGAINIAINEEGFDSTIAQLDPNKTYALYCRSGSRSAQAMQKMKGLGFTKVFDLKGGVISARTR